MMNAGYMLTPSWMEDRADSFTEKIVQDIPRHPSLGSEILSQYDRFSPDILEAVSQHHERWDGSGYPARLAGEDISPFAR